MAQTFEAIFLAIAVKNRLIGQEGARACLEAYKAQPEEARKGIDQIALDRGALNAEQIRAIKIATDRLMVPRSRGTSRYDRKPDPKEPIPGYRITGKLGVGGTATVFLAEDTRNENRHVALKILLPQRTRDPKSIERFQREAGLMIQFDHPNIVRGYDAGKVQYEGAPALHYLALEYMQGESVQDIIDRDGSIPEARAVEVILNAARAVEYLSKNRLIHRDIKPDNLMINAESRIKLLDLGFAIPMGPDGERLEEEGTTSGTVQYMSPEQAQGMKDLDVRTDIYSLGATLYHMVVGEVPFSGEDSLEVMAKQVLEALNSSALKNGKISRHMHYFIERMMSKDKDFRYADPTEMIKDIQEQLEGFESLKFKPDEQSSSVLKGLGKDSKAPARPRTTRIVRRPPTARKRSVMDRFSKRKRR